MSRLTLLMALKGRPLHTLRFLWHAERTRLPYRILIADGAVDERIAGILEAPERLFPHLDIEYMRCPDDVDYAAWYRKMAAAAGRVTTDYVMHAENDDFVMPTGIEQNLSFLDENRDYASCGGGFGAFALHQSAGEMPGVTGTIQSLSSDCFGTCIDCNYASPSASERVAYHFSRCFTLFYNVYRAPAFATLWSECATLKSADLQINETYFGARAKSLGRCRVDRSVMSYLWQAGTSMTQGPIAMEWDRRIHAGWSDDWVEPEFAAEVARFAKAIASAVASCEAIDANSFAAEIERLYYVRVNEQLANHRRRLAAAYERDGDRDGLRSAIVQVARAAIPPFMVRARRSLLRRRARDIMVADLQRHGARGSSVAAFRNELAAIESTLESGAFGRFVERVAPHFLMSHDDARH